MFKPIILKYFYYIAPIMYMSLRCLVDLQYAYKEYFKHIGQKMASITQNIANVLFSAYSKKTSPFVHSFYYDDKLSRILNMILVLLTILPFSGY